MKIRPLPDIDFARITTMPRELQRAHLERLKLTYAPMSYAPLRKNYHDIFNVQHGMFGVESRTPWKKIKELILRKSNNDLEAKSNLEVARGLFEFSEREKIVSTVPDFSSITMGGGNKLIYWAPILLSMSELRLVPFIDPRRTKGLGAEARRFVFSMMHEKIRAADPDFEDVGFMIIQFGAANGSLRPAVLHSDRGIDLYSMDMLEDMIVFTNELWVEVLEDRHAELRETATGTHGLLL